MLHNEARNLLVEAYEKTHDAKGIALAYGVSVPTVYRLAEQKSKTGNVDLRVSERGRKRVLGQEALEKIVSTPVRFCSFSPNRECRKMAGKGVQPLNNYTCRFRPSSLKCTDKSGLDGRKRQVAGNQGCIPAPC